MLLSVTLLRIFHGFVIHRSSLVTLEYYTSRRLLDVFSGPLLMTRPMCICRLVYCYCQSLVCHGAGSCHAKVLSCHANSLTASSGWPWWTRGTSINRTGNGTTTSRRSSWWTASAGSGGAGLCHLIAAASSVCKTVHEVSLHISYCILISREAILILKGRDFLVPSTGEQRMTETEHFKTIMDYLDK